MRSALITGGAGFIGSHLCERLLERGVRVTVVDDLRSGELRNLPLAATGFSFEQLTVGDPDSADRLAQHVADCNIVFHLASPVGVALTNDQPGAIVASILQAGLQIVNLCRNLRRPLLFASSSEVYGPSPPCPIVEDCGLTLSASPRFSYATAKLAVEHLVADLHRKEGVPAWIVRFFNVAGPRQRPEAGVISAFAADLIAGRHLRIHGNGDQTRSFLHVADAAEGLIRIAECPALQGRAVNLGNEHCTSIRELADRMLAECGRRELISYCSYGEVFGEHFVPVTQRSPDTRLLREATGWSPQLTLSDIVRDCVQHARHSGEIAGGNAVSR
jgi:UDP-glucose 4-epimerase